MNAIATTGREQEITTLEAALEKRQGQVAEHEYRLQCLRGWARCFAAGEVQQWIGYEEDTLKTVRAKLHRIRERLAELSGPVTAKARHAARKKEGLAKQDAERERFDFQHSDLIASLRANPSEVNARLREVAKAKLAGKPKRNPTPESKQVLAIAEHAVERYLERVCGASTEEINTLRRTFAGRGSLKQTLAPYIVPSEVLQGVVKVWNTVKQRVLCVPPTHFAVIEGSTVMSVMGWPGAKPYVPPPLWPYFDKPQEFTRAGELVYRVHTPLGPHASVRVSAAHSCGVPCVDGIPVEVVANAARAEMREPDGLLRHEAVRKVAEAYDLGPRQVEDALAYMALPARIRSCWIEIGDWELEQYQAAQRAAKEAA